MLCLAGRPGAIAYLKLYLQLTQLCRVQCGSAHFGPGHGALVCLPPAMLAWVVDTQRSLNTPLADPCHSCLGEGCTVAVVEGIVAVREGAEAGPSGEGGILVWGRGYNLELRHSPAND